MKLTVRIQQRHIDEGKRTYCRECPIALALNEQHPRKGGWWIVCDQAWSIYCERPYNLSKEAIKFYRSFDNGCAVKPLEFEMDIYILRNKK